MKELYTQNEAARALGVTRRTLYTWLKEAGIPTGTWSNTQPMVLSLAQIEQLAVSHKRHIRDINLPRDPLEEVTQQMQQLQEQVIRLEARMLLFEGQLQTLMSLFGNRLSLRDEADEQKG